MDAWVELSKEYHNLGNFIVGFAVLQAIAFLYAFGRSSHPLVTDREREWIAIGVVTALSFFYAMAVAWCAYAERTLIEESAVKDGANRVIEWAMHWRTISILLLWGAQVLCLKARKYFDSSTSSSML